MSSVTEATLAKSAPPEIETTIAVVSRVMANDPRSVATAHTMVAEMSWRLATMLVARCVAPRWVWSPNFSRVAIKVDCDGCSEHVGAVEPGVGDVPNEVSEVQGGREENDEAENDFPEVHGAPCRRMPHYWAVRR